MPKNKPSAKPKAALAKQMSAQAKLTHTPGTKRVLHIEVGATKTQMHKHLSGSEWKTLTLNIDKKTPADFHLYPTNL